MRDAFSRGVDIEPAAGSEPAAEGEKGMMSQIPISAGRRTFATAALVAMIMLAVSAIARAQEVVALVDGQPITALDVEQRTNLLRMGANKAPTRREVIDGLIDETLEIREAKRFNIDATDADVANAFANVASHMGLDSKKLTQVLASHGASAETLKHRLRAEIAWNSLVRGRYKASLEIADTNVEAELQLHKSDAKQDVGYEYIMRPIIFIVPSGSPDAVYEARKREADALRSRFQNCAEGIPFARALAEVAVRDQVIKFSADLPQQSRDIVDGTEVGHLTPPETTAEGVQMFAICSKRVTKSDTPEMRKIRDEIFQRKFGAEAKRYLARLRREAMIEYK
jgi:peptidyl-prolyl cis-trans isomerase SurA